VYFVIPLDRSYGPPVEVVELFSLPDHVTSQTAFARDKAAGETSVTGPHTADRASSAPESNIAMS
jgi:hypothetical protein